MNLTLLDPVFDFNYYYAIALTTIFFCLFYSPSMPFMYLFCSLSLLSLYISTKYIFIRFTRQPKLLDHSLNDTATRIIPFGLLIHVYMMKQFSNEQTVMPVISEEYGTEVVMWVLVVIIVLYMMFKRMLVRVIVYLLRVMGFGVGDGEGEEGEEGEEIQI